MQIKVKVKSKNFIHTLELSLTGNNAIIFDIFSLIIFCFFDQYNIKFKPTYYPINYICHLYNINLRIILDFSFAHKH